MMRLLIIPTALLALVAGAIHWAGADHGEDRADFAFVNRGDLFTLDLHEMAYMQDIRIAYALWEGLYSLDPQTLQPVLGTADWVKVDPSHTVWTLHIRPDARWSNGDPVTADDFLFAWKRYLDVPAEYSYLHYYIRGAKEYSDAHQQYMDDRAHGIPTAPPDFSTVGEKKIDDRTLQVTLTDPIPFFPALLAFPMFFPQHQASMESFEIRDQNTGEVTGYKPEFTKAGSLVTNGPFELTEWTFKRRVRLTASRYYWDRANVRCHTIDQISATDPVAGVRLYESGQVDWVADVDPDVAASLLSRGPRPDLHVFPGFGTNFYDFNCTPTLPEKIKNPMTDVRVRQALAMSIDKIPIVRDVGRLGQPVATTYIPPGAFPGYVSPPGLKFDPDAARSLLAAAGYPGGSGFPHLTILYNSTSPAQADAAQIISRQWKLNLGINVDIDGMDGNKFSDCLHNQEFDIAPSAWYGDYDDPSTFTDTHKSDSENNDTKWSNPKYDALCQAIQKESDPDKRLKFVAQAENVMLNDAPIAPLYIPVGVYLFSDRVHGISLNSREMLMFKGIWVQRP